VWHRVSDPVGRAKFGRYFEAQGKPCRAALDLDGSETRCHTTRVHPTFNNEKPRQKAGLVDEAAIRT